MLTTGPGAFAGPRGAAGAEPAHASASAGATNPNLGPANPGTAVCTVNNTNVDEVTGMVATAQGIYAVEGGDTFDPNSVQIWTINPTSCQATSRNYGFDPADPQDLALGADGALWVADTGDGVGDDNQRDWVTMERVDLASSTQAVPHRTLYPSSGKINALAVLLQQDNAPIVIANGAGKAVLYRPDGALAGRREQWPAEADQGGRVHADQDRHRESAGHLRQRARDRRPPPRRTGPGSSSGPPPTRTSSRSARTATSSRRSPTAPPTITPLPDEENGQAISYSADGKTFLTLGSVDKPVLRSYTPFVPSPRRVERRSARWRGVRSDSASQTSPTSPPRPASSVSSLWSQV